MTASECQRRSRGDDGAMTTTMRPAIRCVVFDLDDTLYLERDYVVSGFRAVHRFVAMKYDRPDFFSTAWRLFLQGVRGHVFDQTLAAMGIRADARLISTLVEVYRNHAPDIKLAPDAYPCLDRLRGCCQTALITDGAPEMQQKKFQALGLPEWISIRVFTGSWGKEYSKPHPRAFEKVLEKAGVASRECVYVADNPLKDFVAPRRMGWRTVRIRRPLGLYSAIAAGDVVPGYEFDNLLPLVALVS